ncbi:hypothetical protein ACFWNC_17120, partial [Streptomyces sp. NPDC058369]
RRPQRVSATTYLPRPPLVPGPPARPGAPTPVGETGTAERLALNRTGSFEWDLDARTLDIDEAGLLVFGLDPASFDARPDSLAADLEPVVRGRRIGA